MIVDVRNFVGVFYSWLFRSFPLILILCNASQCAQNEVEKMHVMTL